MSGVKQKCQLDGCSRAASAQCYCCNKSVCTRHFTEHIDAVKAQIDPLANDINTLVEKIQGLTIEHLTERPLADLLQWKMDMHKLIDEIFFVKNKEIEDLVERNKEKLFKNKKQQLETLMKMQDDVKQLVEDGDATFEHIQLLKNQLANVETNLTSFRNDFLLVNTQVCEQGLVTVSSKLNKPSVNRIQRRLKQPPPSQNPVITFTTAPTNNPFGNITPAGVNPPVVTPAPPFSIKQQSAVSSGFSFGGLSTAVPSPFGAPPSSPSPFGNNAPKFGSNSPSPAAQFSNNEKK